MPVKLIFTPFAELDLLKIKSWYSVDESELFLRFISEFGSLIKLLQSDPQAFPKVYRKKYRKAIMRIFPYTIVYTFDNGLLTIFAVIHQKRNPRTWKSRAI